LEKVRTCDRRTRKEERNMTGEGEKGRFGFQTTGFLPFSPSPV
jgi:hypothetical protein